MFSKFRDHFYQSDRINWNNLTFTRAELWKLLYPLMLEQLLTSFMGMADTMMVTRAGSEAISAVSLVDSINILVIQILSAMAAGGTIICSQYIGHKDFKKCNAAARQVVLTVLMISIPLALLCLILRRPLLGLVFGSVDPAVMENGVTYFFYTSISFPFLALFESGAAFYRAGGNSRFPMTLSVISNCLNIFGNAVLIFGFDMGVAGAAISTLLSRIFSAVVIFCFLRKPRQPIVIDHYLRIRPDFRMIQKVLSIGVPSGIENGMFQFGKLAIQSSVSTLGTINIAANAMMIILENLNGIGGIGIGIGLMTVVGQCIGAGRVEEAKYYIVKISMIAEVVVLVSCAIVFVIAKPVMWLAGMDPEAADICFNMLIYVSIVKPIVWIPAFIPAYGMRSAGDVKFSMIASSITMWCCRVLVTTVLIRVFGFGPIAVWIGMSLDWLVRGIVYSLRYRSGKWLNHTVIS
ncbi:MULTISPECIES: MATE family efflux transporter [unclassified Bilifractor]|uniref:MATE family efflux transporter n=1 Tax=unclassified Bilifractor TaxID=2815795 RepID=UPI003F90E791